MNFRLREPPGSCEVIFQTMLGNQPVVISRANADDVANLYQTSVHPDPRDVLDMWSFIAFRSFPRGASKLHALGRRRALDDVWITSEIVSIHAPPAAIRTKSGHLYHLGDPNRDELLPELMEHLEYALSQWGFLITGPTI